MAKAQACGTQADPSSSLRIVAPVTADYHSDEHSLLLPDNNNGEPSPFSRPPSYATLVSPTDERDSSLLTLPIDSSDDDDDSSGQVDRDNTNRIKRHYKRHGVTKCWKTDSLRKGWQKFHKGLPARDSTMVLINLFVTEASRGLVLPTMWTYVNLMGGNLGTLGTLISLFSIGRLISAVPFGTWADKRGSSREVFIFATILAASCNTLYAFAWALPHPLWWMYVSRTLCGFATGTVAVTRAYLASAVPPAERTKAIAYSGMAQYAGFSLTPGLATLVMWMVQAYHRHHSSQLGPGDDEKNHAALLSCVIPNGALILVNLAMIPLLLSAIPKKDPLPPPPPPTTLPHPPASAARASRAESALLKYGFILFFSLNLVLRGVIGVTETIAPEMYQYHRFNDPQALEHAGQFFFYLGLVGLVVFFLVDPIQRKWVAGHHLLNFGILTVIIGTLLTIDPNPPHTNATWAAFVLGMTLIWSIGSPICQTLTVSMYSTLLGTRPQASLIAWITTAGSIGRILFPFLVGVTDNAAWWVNAMDVVLCIICGVGVVIFERFARRARRDMGEDVEPPPPPTTEEPAAVTTGKKNRNSRSGEDDESRHLLVDDGSTDIDSELEEEEEEYIWPDDLMSNGSSSPSSPRGLPSVTTKPPII
ncbi:major facilitator superfamily domain-containing protein [Phlyctochytrium arcticum]|nr:major facilitator superfamily domain-containing protein [Phlyctochytrium arcticum]